MRVVGLAVSFLVAACAGAPAPMVTAATAPPKSAAGATSIPAAPESSALVVSTKHNVRRFPPSKNAHPPSSGGFAFEPNEACVEEVAWPEVSGGATPEIDAAMNRALKNDHWLFEKEALDQLRACVPGERAKGARSFEVMLNARGVFAVREWEMEQYEGGTHPWDPGAETWLAFDTRTGKKLTRAELFATSESGLDALGKLLDRCLRAYAQDVNGGDKDALDMLREKVSLSNPDLLVLPTDAGLHFAATGYAPPARILEGQGPTITWAALVQAGALGSGSAVGRLTAGGSAMKEVCAKPR